MICDNYSVALIMLLAFFASVSGCDISKSGKTSVESPPYVGPEPPVSFKSLVLGKSTFDDFRAEFDGRLFSERTVACGVCLVGINDTYAQCPAVIQFWFVDSVLAKVQIYVKEADRTLRGAVIQLLNDRFGKTAIAEYPHAYFRTDPEWLVAGTTKYHGWVAVVLEYKPLGELIESRPAMPD